LQDADNVTIRYKDLHRFNGAPAYNDTVNNNNNNNNNNNIINIDTC